MTTFIQKYIIQIIIWFFIAAYISYFSSFSILRYQTLYASYFDLGIMHQTVYNTYRAIVERDTSRILELTNPFGPEQIKRMAIHNDIFLALLSPFYFIHDGPETLLVIQTIILALGSFGVFIITKYIFKTYSYGSVLALFFSLAYLFYPPMQRANIFDFHAVTLSTSLLLFMFYFYLKRKYLFSFLFLLFALMTKEHVGLTTAFFGIYVLIKSFMKNNENESRETRTLRKFAITVISISVLWFLVSMLYIIPFSRGNQHFALEYYDGAVADILAHPLTLMQYLFRAETWRYWFFLAGPLGFLAFFAPLELLITLPELAINLLSSNANMRNIIYHYTSVLQPFVFITSIYGTKHVVNFLLRRYRQPKIVMLVGIYIIGCALIFSFSKGPLPYSREQNVHPFKWPQKEAREAQLWMRILADDSFKISSTGQLAPLFTSRRYFYIFSQHYALADYLILRPREIYNYPEKEILIPVYERLQKDPEFEHIYKGNNFEVYKKSSKLKN